MRACEVTVVVEGKEIISMNHQAHGGDKNAIDFKEEILECAEMLTSFCGVMSVVLKSAISLKQENSEEIEFQNKQRSLKYQN